MRVLLVGHDGVVRLYLAEVLGAAGMSVTAAPDADRALARGLVGTPAPAVLVSDVKLGRGMDGIALAAEARRRWPGVRVVMMSGTPGNRDRCGLRAHDRFLPKPFTDAALLRAIGSRSDPPEGRAAEQPHGADRGHFSIATSRAGSCPRP